MRRLLSFLAKLCKFCVKSSNVYIYVDIHVNTNVCGTKRE